MHLPLGVLKRLGLSSSRPIQICFGRFHSGLQNAAWMMENYQSGRGWEQSSAPIVHGGVGSAGVAGRNGSDWWMLLSAPLKPFNVIEIGCRSSFVIARVACYAPIATTPTPRNKDSRASRLPLSWSEPSTVPRVMASSAIETTTLSPACTCHCACASAGAQRFTIVCASAFCFSSRKEEIAVGKDVATRIEAFCIICTWGLHPRTPGT